MAKQRTRPTPHRFSVDLSELRGVTVLGEPLDVLFSALLRLRMGKERGGMVEMRGALPRREGEAVARAMCRTEREISGDQRSDGERDLDRFLIMIERVFEAGEAVRHGRRQVLAQPLFQRPALPG